MTLKNQAKEERNGRGWYQLTDALPRPSPEGEEEWWSGYQISNDSFDQ